VDVRHWLLVVAVDLLDVAVVVVDDVVVDFGVRYRWGIIVNHRDGCFVVRDSVDKYKLEGESLNLMKPEKSKTQ